MVRIIVYHMYSMLNTIEAKTNDWLFIMYNSIYLSVDGYLVCAQFWTLMNNATMNNSVQCGLCPLIHLSVDLGGKMLGKLLAVSLLSKNICAIVYHK